nr:hypothetical protein HK105_007267 [Polyrhizophydium stewartii]
MGLTAGGNAGSRIDDYGMRDNGRRVEAELIAAKNIEEPHVDDGQNAAIRKEAAAMVESIMARVQQPSAIIGGRAMWHGLLLGELDAVQVMIDDYCGSEASSLLEGGQACISAGQPCRASQSNLAAEQMMTPAEMAAHAAEVGVPVEHVRIFAGHYDMLAARAKLREAEIRIAGRHGEESGRERRIEAKSKPSRLWGCFRGLCFWLKSKSSISRASSSSSFVAPAPTAEVEAPHGGRPSTLSAASTQADGVSGDADSHQSRGGRQGRKLSDLFSRAVWWRKRSDAGKAAATQPQQQPCSA